MKKVKQIILLMLLITSIYSCNNDENEPENEENIYVFKSNDGFDRKFAKININGSETIMNNQFINQFINQPGFFSIGLVDNQFTFGVFNENRTIFRINLSTGDYTAINLNNEFYYSNFVINNNIVFAYKSRPNFVKIVQIDLNTNNETVLADLTNEVVEIGDSPHDFNYNPTTNQIIGTIRLSYSMGNDYNFLYKVDISSGNYSVLPLDNSTPFINYSSVLIDENGEFLILKNINTTSSEFIEIDLNNEENTVLNFNENIHSAKYSFSYDKIIATMSPYNAIFIYDVNNNYNIIYLNDSEYSVENHFTSNIDLY